jgi:hypothetical protein
MDPVLQQQIIDFLKANLTLQAVNNVSPWDTSDNFDVSLVLCGNIISTVTLNVNDGQT